MQKCSLKSFTQSEVIIDTSYFFFHYMKGSLFRKKLLNLLDVLDSKKAVTFPEKNDVNFFFSKSEIAPSWQHDSKVMLVPWWVVEI